MDFGRKTLKKKTCYFCGTRIFCGGRCLSHPPLSWLLWWWRQKNNEDCHGFPKVVDLWLDSQRWLRWIPKGGWFVVGFPKVVDLWLDSQRWLSYELTGNFHHFANNQMTFQPWKQFIQNPLETPTAPAGPRGWGSCQFQHRSRSDDVGWLGNILTKQSSKQRSFPQKMRNIIPKYEILFLQTSCLSR